MARSIRPWGDQRRYRTHRRYAISSRRSVQSASGCHRRSRLAVTSSLQRHARACRERQGYHRTLHIAQRDGQCLAVRQGSHRRNRQCERAGVGSSITLALSRPAIAALVPNFSSAFGRPISSDNRALGLLNRYLDVLQAGDEFESREIARSVSTHILDLAALALGARGDDADLAKLRGAKAARLFAIRSDILAKLGHGELSME